MDWVCLTWDADLRLTGDHWSHHDFRGDRWHNINGPDDRTYLLNAYRVLLTQARQAMVVFAPLCLGRGDSNGRQLGALHADEYVFFSRLPQALSTEAEMMARYVDGTGLDGRRACLQRVHVTGGTNGILVDSLRRLRPFTPGFIGRAEDQAYVLSTIGGGDRLGYAHAAGLFMRHDKEGFAQDAMALAKAGKEIGDYARILMFSSYARVIGLCLSGARSRHDERPLLIAGVTLTRDWQTSGHRSDPPYRPRSLVSLWR